MSCHQLLQDKSGRHLLVASVDSLVAPTTAAALQYVGFVHAQQTRSSLLCCRQTAEGATPDTPVTDPEGVLLQADADR